jgi:hypothetical protein
MSITMVDLNITDAKLNALSVDIVPGDVPLGTEDLTGIYLTEYLTSIYKYYILPPLLSLYTNPPYILYIDAEREEMLRRGWGGGGGGSVVSSGGAVAVETETGVVGAVAVEAGTGTGTGTEAATATGTEAGTEAGTEVEAEEAEAVHVYPMGSVIATVEVQFKTHEEYLNHIQSATGTGTGTGTESGESGNENNENGTLEDNESGTLREYSSARACTTCWTFQGCISGQNELDWRIVAFDGMGGSVTS